MVHVAVIGAAGGIGQPLALLLKTQLPAGSILSLFDVFNAPGVAADLSHIDTPATIRTAPTLEEVAKGVDVFVIVAGKPRQPGMKREDLFKINAGIAFNIVLTCGKVAPKAVFCMVTNPVNATVPIAAQALKKLGIYNKNKVLGVTTLDMLRATTFLNEKRPEVRVNRVPIIGGHSDATIVPLFSQVPGLTLSAEEIAALTARTRQGGTEVVKAKAGKGSATLSMAAAGARMTMLLVRAMLGQGNPVAYCYIDTDGTHALPFLAAPVMLGLNGLEKRLPLGEMNDVEKKMFAEAEPIIAKNIAAGEKFARAKL